MQTEELSCPDPSGSFRAAVSVAGCATGEKTVVIGAGLLLFVSFGSAYAVPIFFPLLGSALNAPEWHLGALFSLTGATYFVLGLASGRLAKQVGAHVAAAAGQAALAIGLLMMSLARSELAFDVACLFGIGVGVGLCFVPVTAAVQALCRHNPALAGGIAASGIGAGTLALPLLAHLLADHFGWRAALQGLSFLALCGIGPAMWLAPRRGALPTPTRSAAARMTAARPPTSGAFRQLYAAQLLLSLVAFVPFAHLGLFARTEGFSVAIGVYLISLIGLGSLVGRVVIGVVAEQLGSCRTASLCTAMMACAFLGLIALPQSWELGCATVLYGIGYGGANGLLGPIVAEIAGVEDIFRSVGAIATSRGLGILVGPWGIGVVEFDLGCYKIPFLICAGIAGMASVIFAALHRGAAETDAIPLRAGNAT